MKNILIVVLLIAVIGLGYLQLKPKLGPIISPQTAVAPTAQPANTVGNPVNTGSQPAAVPGSKKYANAQYGFSFSYPDTWKVTENPATKEVIIDTNDRAGVNPENKNNPSYPSWSISFTATDKTYFTKQTISTKFGNITYDENTKALMADSCLKAGPLLGTGPVMGIRYGGSLMSDPAYSDSAILTANGEIILVHSQQGVPATPEIMDVLSKITQSFMLLNGNTVFVPACAQ